MIAYIFPIEIFLLILADVKMPDGLILRTFRLVSRRIRFYFLFLRLILMMLSERIIDSIENKSISGGKLWVCHLFRDGLKFIYQIYIYFLS